MVIKYDGLPKLFLEFQIPEKNTLSNLLSLHKIVRTTIVFGKDNNIKQGVKKLIIFIGYLVQSSKIDLWCIKCVVYIFILIDRSYGRV